MMDTKTYAALGTFSNSEKDHFKKWASQFEDVTMTTYGAAGKAMLVKAASGDVPAKTLAEMDSDELILATDAWVALGFKLDAIPWSMRLTVENTNGLQLWRTLVKEYDAAGKGSPVIIKTKLQNLKQLADEESVSGLLQMVEALRLEYMKTTWRSWTEP